MLFIFDIDSTLIRGHLVSERCDECEGTGRVGEGIGQECEPCLGKGRRFTKSRREYDLVEPLPGRIEKVRELAQDPEARFALATNQGGIGFGFQTREQIDSKIARTVEAFEGFHGRPWSTHAAFHHPKAKLEEWRDVNGEGLRKPLPGMLVAAMDHHQVGRDETLMVGDMATDEQAAQAAGVRYVWAWEFFEDGDPE